MDHLGASKIEQLNDRNYPIWSMKMEALLDAKDLFEQTIVGNEPTLDESNATSLRNHAAWIKKNKEALGILVLSLTAEQAIVYRGIKKAKDIWEAIKLRFEGATEDRSTDLLLELTKLKKSRNESIEEYLTRSQGLTQQINGLGKRVTDRELVRYIVEGLPEDYETIVLALSTNRGISFTDLRQTLLNFEKKHQDKKNDFKAFKTQDRYRMKPKTCFICHRPGHCQKECWFNDNNTNKKFFKKHNHHPKRQNSHRNEYAKITEEKLMPKKEMALSIHENRDNGKVFTQWHLDSACTSHMTPHEHWMENVKEENKIISVAEEGRDIESTYRGEIKMTCEESDQNIRLKNVLCVPKLRCNLMSVPSIVKNGNEVILNKEGAFIYNQEGELVCKGNFKENMFVIDLKLREKEKHLETCFKIKENSYELWHRRLGHINPEYLKLMVSKNMVRGMQKIEGDAKICDSCVRGKMTRCGYESTYSEICKGANEAWHVDLCGPFRIESMGGKKYILTIVDQYTRRYFVEFLRSKNETTETLKKVINRRENELNIKLKRIRSDNGLEFTNEDLRKYFEMKGIKHEKTTFYSPRSNGIAERANRSLLDKARTLLIDSQLPSYFWAEAVATAEYLHNITPTKCRKDMTPMEIWSGKKPSVRHLKTFGCLAYYKVHDNKRHKLEPKARRGVFIGYSRERKAFRIYDIDEKKVHESSDVTFNESLNGYKSTECQEITTNYLEITYPIYNQEKIEENKPTIEIPEDEIQQEEIIDNNGENEIQQEEIIDNDEENETSESEEDDKKIPRRSNRKDICH